MGARASETLLAELRASRFGGGLAVADALSMEDEALSSEERFRLGWPELEALLPEGGLPRGVVEIASRGVLAGATTMAARAIAQVHAKSPDAYAAWLDPEATLFGPGLVREGIDLERLFVVRPPRKELARIAVKVASAGAFEIVVIDQDAIEGAKGGGEIDRPKGRTRRPIAPEWVVKKLAVAAEKSNGCVILLTDSRVPREAPWPVTLRLELARRPDALGVRVAKEPRARIGLAKTWLPMDLEQVSRAPLARTRGAR